MRGLKWESSTKKVVTAILILLLNDENVAVSKALFLFLLLLFNEQQFNEVYISKHYILISIGHIKVFTSVYTYRYQTTWII